MFKHATLLGVAMLAISPAALAAGYSTSATVQSNSTYLGSNVNLTTSQSHYDGSDTVISPLPGSEVFTGGFKGEAKASASDSQVSASSKAMLGAANGALTSFSNGQVNSNANVSDWVNLNGDGKVRFHLDYTLDATGKNGSAGFSFYANTNGSFDPYSDTYASFGDSISTNGGSASKSGSWASDWLSFNSAGWGSSFYYNLMANSSADRWNPLLGTSSGNVNVNFSYELDVPVGGTPPVPEPETYAMLLAGLSVVGLAVRRRTRRN